jgi:hypothetical protein
MKKLALFIGACLAVLPAAWGQGGFQITKIQPSIIRTPDYQYQGDQRRTPQSERWLEVEVEFTADAEYTEEATFKYYILLVGKCLTGEVTHVNIPKGRELRSVMYLAPRTLTRLLEGKTMTAVSIEDVGVQILVRGQVLATRSFKARGEVPWWQSMQQINGLVLNKNETPFAPLYWDRYEAIKASAR